MLYYANIDRIKYDEIRRLAKKGDEIVKDKAMKRFLRNAAEKLDLKDIQAVFKEFIVMFSCVARAISNNTKFAHDFMLDRFVEITNYFLRDVINNHPTYHIEL